MATDDTRVRVLEMRLAHLERALSIEQRDRHALTSMVVRLREENERLQAVLALSTCTACACCGGQGYTHDGGYVACPACDVGEGVAQ